MQQNVVLAFSVTALAGMAVMVLSLLLFM